MSSLRDSRYLVHGNALPNKTGSSASFGFHSSKLDGSPRRPEGCQRCLVVMPIEDGELSRFTGWLTLTHTQRWHAYRHSTGTGHVYLGQKSGDGVVSIVGRSGMRRHERYFPRGPFAVPRIGLNGSTSRRSILNWHHFEKVSREAVRTDQNFGPQKSSLV